MLLLLAWWWGLPLTLFMFNADALLERPYARLAHLTIYIMMTLRQTTARPCSGAHGTRSGGCDEECHWPWHSLSEKQPLVCTLAQGQRNAHTCNRSCTHFKAKTSWHVSSCTLVKQCQWHVFNLTERRCLLAWELFCEVMCVHCTTIISMDLHAHVHRLALLASTHSQLSTSVNHITHEWIHALRYACWQVFAASAIAIATVSFCHSSARCAPSPTRAVHGMLYAHILHGTFFATLSDYTLGCRYKALPLIHLKRVCTSTMQSSYQPHGLRCTVTLPGELDAQGLYNKLESGLSSSPDPVCQTPGCEPKAATCDTNQGLQEMGR